MRKRAMIAQAYGALALSAVALTFFSGCTTLPADAVQRIERARKHYQANQYTDAERLVNLVIDGYPETKGVGAAYYLRGMCNYRKKRDPQARSDFHKALQTSSDPEVMARAHAQLGHIAFQADDYRRAIAHYVEVVKTGGEVSFMDQVYYRYGDSLQKAGQWQAARKIFPKVWTLFPDSEFAPFARRKFAWVRNSFAIQCAAFNRSDLAHDFANDLRRKGLDASTDVNLRGERAKHVVHVGRYSSFRDARDDLARVRQVAADAFIVP